jgi:hypothetical protein
LIGRRLILATVVLIVAASVATAGTADIMFVVDVSGSMSGEHAWIASMVTSLETALVNAGITGNQYGLVAYGGSTSSGDPYKVNVGGGDWGDDSDLSTAAGTLVASGGTEDGYEAIQYALDNYSFRGGAVKNFILITDEDRDNTSSDTFTSIEAALDGFGLLNVVVNAALRDGSNNVILGYDKDGNTYAEAAAGGFTTGTGGYTLSAYGTTEADYIDLAHAVEVNTFAGAAWDLNQLRAGGNTALSFTNAFVDLKVEEIVNVVPLPAAVWAGMALLGLGAIRRVRRRR